MPRPKCINHGCENPVTLSSGSVENVKTRRVLRTVCRSCHEASYGKKLLPENIKAHKKDFCENIDGRLGFTCTTTIKFSGQLELDHIDGNHFNNVPDNVQTLCKDCHSYKSFISGDYKKSNKKNNFFSNLID
jgi:5-methylcytosine-specific restriction endonuclease McrA